MVGQAIEERRRHLGVAKYTGPIAKGQIGGDDDRGALVEPADQMKEPLAAGLSEGQIAEFVENNEVHAGEIFGEPPLPAGAGFTLQPIDEIDDRIEAASGAAADAGPRKAIARCDLPVPVPPISTALRCSTRKAPLARSRISASLTGVPVKSKSSMSPAFAGAGS